MSIDEKEKKFEAAQEAYQSARLMLVKTESELNTAAADYYESRFGVTIGASVIECPSEKIPLSLIVGLIRVTGGICQWQLAPIQKDGKPASRVYHLSAEAPITVIGQYIATTTVKRKNQVPASYRNGWHIKSGKEYRLLHIAKNKADQTEIAVYEDDKEQVWTRPLIEFNEKFKPLRRADG